MTFHLICENIFEKNDCLMTNWLASVPRAGAQAARRGRFERYFWPMAALCLAAIWTIFGIVADQSYRSKRQLVTLATSNMAVLLEHDIARNIEMCDRSLKQMVAELSDPRFMELPPELRNRLILQQAADTSGIGAEAVLDENGRFIIDSHVPSHLGTDLSFRDYFKVHRDGAYGDRLFISQPFESRTEPGVRKIALTRRIDKPGGGFGGIVIIAIRLDYFQDLYSRVNLPADSVLTLADEQGAIIFRVPADLPSRGRHVPAISAFGASGQQSAEVDYRSEIDGVMRFHILRRIGSLPLIQGIGLSESKIFEDWRPEADALAGAFVLLSLFIAGLAVALRRELRRRAEAERTLTVIAATDALTGLANRRRFDEVADAEWRRGIRQNTPVSLIMLDCDHFKAFNDAYGHIEGDAALVRVARAIGKAIGRPGDLAARIGGEEFAVLLPDTAAEGALVVAERIREMIKQENIPHAASPVSAITVSAGIASRVPGLAEPVTELIREADTALYEAKAKGRNRVVSTILAFTG